MSGLPQNREIYPSAPLKLVACELRIQLAPGSDVGGAAMAFYGEVSEKYPLEGQAPVGIRLTLGPEVPPTQELVSGGFRYLSRDKTKSVTVTPQALVIETSAYTHFEAFAGDIAEAVLAVGRHLSVVSVERVGLRYIDEIELSKLPGGVVDGYFSEAVLGNGRAVDGVGEPLEFLVNSSYALGDERQARMRTGRVNTPTVAANGPLRIPSPSVGPLFVIDVDCFWGSQTPQEFTIEAIGSILDSLHAPVRALFEGTITDKLRNEVLRKEPAGV